MSDDKPDILQSKEYLESVANWRNNPYYVQNDDEEPTDEELIDEEPVKPAPDINAEKRRKFLEDMRIKGEANKKKSQQFFAEMAEKREEIRKQNEKDAQDEQNHREMVQQMNEHQEWWSRPSYNVVSRYSRKVLAEYKTIKYNFLEEIREKIKLFDQTLVQCEYHCQQDCPANYAKNRLNRQSLEIQGGQLPEEDGSDDENISTDENTSVLGSLWDKARSGFSKFTTNANSAIENVSTRVRQGSETSNTTSETSSEASETSSAPSEASSEASETSSTTSGDSGNFITRAISGYKKSVDEKKKGVDEEKSELFCDNTFKNKRTSRRVYSLCSMPDRISSEGTQQICKLVLDMENDIRDLINIYKNDTKEEAASVARKKADFLQLVDGNGRAGGAKRTKKRRRQRRRQ